MTTLTIILIAYFTIALITGIIFYKYYDKGKKYKTIIISILWPLIPITLIFGT